MAARHDDQHRDGDRESQISKVKERLAEMSHGHMVTGGTVALPVEEQERFWRRVLAFANGPFTTDVERLVKAGVELPQPDSMNDHELTTKLWQLIHNLARMRAFITQTDHLSDRELYSHLWRDLLRAEIPAGSDDEEGVWHVDLLSTGSDENTHLYLKFYVEDEERKLWLEIFPDYAMPPHEQPTYDRDRHLP